MNQNLLFASLYNSPVTELPIVDFWTGQYGDMRTLVISRQEREDMKLTHSIFETSGKEKILYIPDDINIFEFFDVVFQSIFDHYNGNIPKNHPVHQFIQEIKNFCLQFLLQSTEFIKIGDRYITRDEMKDWMQKSQNHLSQEFRGMFTTFEFTKSQIKKILQKDLFTPESFHDTLENTIYNFTYQANKFEEQNFDKEFYRKMAFTAISLHKYDEALEFAKIGLDIFGEDYELLLYAGECYYHKDEEDVSYNFFQRALLIDPSGSQAIGYLCILDFPKTLYKGENGELKVNELLSKKLLKKALFGYNITPDSYNLLITIGKLYYNLGNYTESAKYLEILNDLYFGSLDHIVFLVNSYEFSQQYNKALKFLIKVLPDYSKNHYFWDKMGFYFEKIGDISLSQKFLYIASVLQKVDYHDEGKVEDKNIIDQYLQEKDFLGLIRWLYGKIN